MVSIQRTPARRLRLRLMGTDRSAVVRLPDSRAGLTQRAAELFLDDDAAATGGTLPAARLYLGGSFELRDFELLRDDDEVVVAFGEPGGAYPGPHASTLVRPAHDAAFAEWLAAEAPIALAQLASWAAIPAPNRWLVRLRMMFGLFHTRWVRKLFQLGFTSYVPFLISIPDPARRRGPRPRRRRERGRARELREPGARGDQRDERRLPEHRRVRAPYASPARNPTRQLTTCSTLLCVRIAALFMAA